MGKNILLENKYMDRNLLKQIHDIQLEILLEFNRICRKHNLKYFLDSGTAIGAVRHKGFIPWDDDIDIGMLRSDYNQFLKIAEKELKEGYFLECTATEKECPYLFAKIRKDNTIFMEWCHRNIKMHQGIYIDIFPYDTLPEDKKKQIKFIKKYRRINKLFKFRTSPDRDLENDHTLKWIFLQFIYKTIHGGLSLIPRKFFIHMADKHCQKYSKKKPNYISPCMFKKILVFQYEELFPTVDMMFETYMLPMPGNYESYLKKQYGNYMKMPPKEQRVGHVPYKVKIKKQQ